MLSNGGCRPRRPRKFSKIGNSKRPLWAEGVMGKSLQTFHSHTISERIYIHIHVCKHKCFAVSTLLHCTKPSPSVRHPGCMSGQARLGLAKPGQARPGLARPGLAGPCYAALVQPGRTRLGITWPGPVRAVQARLGQAWPGQARLGQAGPALARPARF